MAQARQANNRIPRSMARRGRILETSNNPLEIKQPQAVNTEENGNEGSIATKISLAPTSAPADLSMHSSPLSYGEAEVDEEPSVAIRVDDYESNTGERVVEISPQINGLKVFCIQIKETCLQPSRFAKSSNNSNMQKWCSAGENNNPIMTIVDTILPNVRGATSNGTILLEHAIEIDYKVITSAGANSSPSEECYLQVTAKCPSVDGPATENLPSRLLDIIEKAMRMPSTTFEIDGILMSSGVDSDMF